MQDRTVEVVLVPHPPPELQGPSLPSLALPGSVHLSSPEVRRRVLMSQRPQRSLTHLSAVGSEWAGREGQVGALYPYLSQLP